MAFDTPATPGAMTGPMPNAMPPADAGSGIAREEPEGNDGRRALITRWVSRVQQDRAHWQTRKFKQMRKDSDFARGFQWPGQKENPEDDRYVANLVQRHIQGRVASLYAKNPRFIARRKPKLDFAVWDENPDSAMEVMQQLQMASQYAAQGIAPPPEAAAALMQAQALMQDIMAGGERRKLLDKIGKTMEILIKNQVDEQHPPFKKQMKQLVRRTVTTAAGWLKLGYERVMQPRPEDADKIRDLTTTISEIKRRMADAQDGEDCSHLEVEKQELEEMLRAVQQRDQELTREGLVFDFPPPTTIIPDRRCRQLHGFLGARHVTQEFTLAADEVKRIYGVDVKSIGFTPYRDDDGAPVVSTGDSNATEDSLVKVYEIYEKATKTTFTIAEGCPVYLREPGEPDVQIDRFWPFFCLTFNDIEHETEIYPPSDVELLRHQQLEHNRARQALREHRADAAPGYATARGALTDDDKELLQNRAPHSVVELDGLQPGQKVADIMQSLPQHGIDQNLYETNSIFDDIMKVAGVQEANIGGTSGATATETSVAEGSRMASVASCVDDLDDFMNELARAASQILLREFDEATVKAICGPGAIWPQLTAQEIADELMLEIEAGSSGKPNRAADIKNFMDMAPILMQIPGIKPDWLAKEGLKRLDDRLDLTDAFLAGLPSVMAQNRQAQQGSGQPGEDPNQQGGQGGDNAEKPAQPGQPNEQPAAGAAPNPGQAMSPLG
jgi:hypothetical protein